MKFLWIFLFMIMPVSLQAYSTKNVSIDNSQYIRYVKPQIKSIFQDYYKLISLFDNNLEKLSKSYPALLNTLKEKHTVSFECTKQQNNSCKKKLSLLQKQVFTLKEKISYTQKTKLKSFTPIKEKSRRELIQNLDNILYIIQTAKTSQDNQNSIALLQKKLESFNVQFNFLILNHFPKHLSSHFNLLWREFYVPLSREIIIKNNKKFLKLRLNELNTAWNSFNMIMTKRGIPLPKGAETRLDIIHRRWRSVLKLILKRK